MSDTRSEITRYAAERGWETFALARSSRYPDRATSFAHHDCGQRVVVHATWTPSGALSTIEAFRDGLTASRYNALARHRLQILRHWLDNPHHVPEAQS